MPRKLQINTRTFTLRVNEQLRVSTVMALKLSKVSGGNPERWLLMQQNLGFCKARSEIDMSSYAPIDIERLLLRLLNNWYREQLKLKVSELVEDCSPLIKRKPKHAAFFFLPPAASIPSPLN